MEVGIAGCRVWVERDWEREGEASGCEIVCVRACVCVCVGGGGMRVRAREWTQGRRSDRVRYVMHY